MDIAPRTVPVMTSDEEVQGFLTQDLSQLDFSQFKRGMLEFAPKDTNESAHWPSTEVAQTHAKAIVPDVRQAGAPRNLV